MATQQQEWTSPKGKTSREISEEGWKVSYHIITRGKAFCSFGVEFAFGLQKQKPIINKRKEKEKHNKATNHKIR